MWGVISLVFLVQYFWFNGGNIALMAAIAFAFVDALNSYTVNRK